VAGLREADALFLDLFEKFIEPLESELGQRSTHAAGRFHGIAESQDYKRRIEAINFTLPRRRRLPRRPGRGRRDPGRREPLRQDAHQPLPGHAVRHQGRQLPADPRRLRAQQAAVELPLPQQAVRPHHRPDRLSQIRQERRPNSRYASIENCLHEIEAAQRMMKREGIKWLDSTAKSIEEISTIILQEVRLDPPSTNRRQADRRLCAPVQPS
jgi:hypothetical protein